MSRSVYEQIVAMAREPQAQERTLQYLTEHLGSFLRRQERVLICFQAHEPGNLSWLMEQAVLRCGAVPVVWKEDRRWKTLLRQAFITKASVIIGAPLVVLGLTKLKKAYATPLFVRRVITAGYPCLDWMIDGIAKGFDCVVGGCYGLGATGVVAGFACGQSWGVHLREIEYGVDIIDENGAVQPPGTMGEILIYPREKPELRFATGEWGRIEDRPCKCGCRAVRILDFRPGTTEDPDLLPLGQELQSWTSILDCRLAKGDCGLEVEIVAFPGEKLPKLPSAAKLDIHYLDIERQEPYWYDPSLKNPVIRMEND